jgi:hypothetical protein
MKQNETAQENARFETKPLERFCFKLHILLREIVVVSFLDPLLVAVSKLARQ